MTNRELFHATMRRENGHQLLHFEQGFNAPYRAWYEQGLPRHVQRVSWAKLTEKENLFDHFNVSGFLFCNMYEQFCIPGYEPRILSDDGLIRIEMNSHGNKQVNISNQRQNRLNGSNVGSPPQEIDFAIKTPRDYEENRFRFIGNIDKRVDWKWLDEHATAYREQNDFVTAVWVHGPFAYLQELLGTEKAMLLPFEEPEMICRMLKDHLERAKAASMPIIQACRPDIGFIWEDCCGSTGPFISPSIFDEIFAWWYREWKDHCYSLGVQWNVLDTDGNPSALVSRWYGNGIDLMHPLEVNGIDMLRFAREYPQL